MKYPEENEPDEDRSDDETSDDTVSSDAEPDKTDEGKGTVVDAKV